MSHIHPTAVIEDGAQIGADCTIGPFCVIGAQVKLGAGSVLHSHVAIAGDTAIGENAKIFPFASVGHAPQDLKYRDEPSRLVIGSHVLIRENVTINPGTQGGGLLTSLGDHVVLLAGAHVAHDCQIGHHVILVNNVMLAGHCSIGDHAIIGGGAATHQYVRVGPHAFVGGMSALENDLIPYGTALGNRAYLGGLNIVGLKRRGFNREDIHALRRAYRLLFAEEGTLKERVEDVAGEFGSLPLVQEIVTFIREGSDRAICVPRENALEKV
jgi:UDP-N-acetylglucosamine acyltransferase